MRRKMASYPPGSPTPPNPPIRKPPCPEQDAEPLRPLEREHPSPPRNHIEDELSVLPVLELAPALPCAIRAASSWWATVWPSAQPQQALVSPVLAHRTSAPLLEEAHSIRAIAHQHVLGLLVVLEHHLVVLAPDAGLLVTAKRRMSRIEVEAVGPNPAGLDLTAKVIRAVHIPRPHPGP